MYFFSTHPQKKQPTVLFDYFTNLHVTDAQLHLEANKSFLCVAELWNETMILEVGLKLMSFQFFVT